jgi:hypothetical protein
MAPEPGMAAATDPQGRTVRPEGLSMTVTVEELTFDNVACDGDPARRPGSGLSGC